MRRFVMWFQTIRDIRRSYITIHGQPPRLFRPRSFSEKMQWRKLFDRNPLFKIFCDKLATRNLISTRIGDAYLAPLYWTGDADEIPFDRLAPPYFLKSTHASGHVICVTDYAARDPEAIRARAATWLQTCYFAYSGEPGYKDIPRRLVAEQALLTNHGKAPDERRLFVFNGKVAVINTVVVEDGRVRNAAFHTQDWKKLDWHFTRLLEGGFPQPKLLEDMIRVAEILGNGIDHIRVDIFDCGEKFFVGELSPYSWSGFSRFNAHTADLALGRYWRLKWPLWRAIFAVIFRNR